MRRPWTFALAAVGAVVLAGGGYAVGTHSTGSDGPSCAEASRVANGFVDEWLKPGQDDARRQLKARAAADVITRHHDCFSLSSKVQAQAAAEQLSQSGSSVETRLAAGTAVCEATGRQPFSCQP